MSSRLLLLIVRLPPNPSSLRVRVWRRLRALGAVALKRTVYLLPDTPDHYEHFQWLAQEIQREGGEATLLRVDQIENMSPQDVVHLFYEAREPEFRRLAGRYRKLLQNLDRKSAATSQRVQVELAQLEREYEKLHELDFFDAPAGAEVERLREAISMRTRPSEEPKWGEKMTGDLRGLRGRQWITRRRPHVDRLASAWLIKRFIDSEATFLFADPKDFPAGTIPFDTPGAELSHVGEDCTFETILKRVGLRDRRLSRLAEIVHEADLRDGKFPRDEAQGIDLAIRGLLAANSDDHQVLEHGLALFEGLYLGSSRKE
jgi:hypothetical protein